MNAFRIYNYLYIALKYNTYLDMESNVDRRIIKKELRLASQCYHIFSRHTFLDPWTQTCSSTLLGDTNRTYSKILHTVFERKMMNKSISKIFFITLGFTDYITNIPLHVSQTVYDIYIKRFTNLSYFDTYKIKKQSILPEHAANR